MSDKSTIAINKEVKNKLLAFIHSLEEERKERIGYSEAINILLKNVDGGN